jgi:hypothetical protein
LPVIRDSAKSTRFNLNEDREFQLRLLEIQRSYDTFNAFLTTVQAVIYSFVIAIISIIITVKLSNFVQTMLVIALIVDLIVGVVSTVLLIFFHKRTVQKQIDSLRQEFVMRE